MRPMSCEEFEEELASALNGIDWNNPESVQRLESLAMQKRESRRKYSLECNLLVLKFYNIYPSMFNLEVVTVILAKALMNLPDTDFTEALYQIPERNQKLTPIVELMGLEEKLQSCKFWTFWECTKSDDNKNQFLTSIDGFAEAIRCFIAGVVSVTYHIISQAELLEMLDLSTIDCAEFRDLLQQNGWQLTDSNVKIASSQSQQPQVQSLGPSTANVMGSAPTDEDPLHSRRDEDPRLKTLKTCIHVLGGASSCRQERTV